MYHGHTGSDELVGLVESAGEIRRASFGCDRRSSRCTGVAAGLNIQFPHAAPLNRRAQELHAIERTEHRQNPARALPAVHCRTAPTSTWAWSRPSRACPSRRPGPCPRRQSSGRRGPRAQRRLAPRRPPGCRPRGRCASRWTTTSRCRRPTRVCPSAWTRSRRCHRASRGRCTRRSTPFRPMPDRRSPGRSRRPAAAGNPMREDRCRCPCPGRRRSPSSSALRQAASSNPAPAGGVNTSTVRSRSTNRRPSAAHRGAVTAP